MSEVKRRDVLKLMMLGSGALFTPVLFSGCGGSSDAQSEWDYFPQSVASGDPRENSVILWTRVEDLSGPGQDLLVDVEIATDEMFEDIVRSEMLVAYALFDNCIKIRADDLEPYTYYYYRFRYAKRYSRTGRTKTAPLSSDTQNISFSSVSCQDYIGRYYNAYAHMSQFDELDFIVHLGDYIYETSGDPRYQSSDEERSLTFRDLEGAITLEAEGTLFYAARSLDNYRQLYQLYRSDEMLQAIHESFPMIAIWDDHEYSDDSFGASANYLGGRSNEEDPERKQNSQRAYLEYMPLEVGLDDDGVMTPKSTIMLDEAGAPVIYRDFHFGQDLHLVLTDYRTYRPDHLIAEDAFPGTVFADKAALIRHYDTLSDGDGEASYFEKEGSFGPYIDVDTAPYDTYRAVLIQVALQMYLSEGIGLIGATRKASEVIKGTLSAFVVNEMLKGYNSRVAAESQQTLIFEEEGDEAYEALEKGLAFIHLGKADLFATAGIGSRYMVVKEAFDIYRSLQGKDDVYGEKQQSWIDERLDSDAAWRFYASSVSMTPMVVDLSGFEELPAELRTMFYINVDQFDGFTHKREEILEKLRRNRSVIISGDIHSTFITEHHAVAEFTGTSISSITFSEMLFSKILESDIVLQVEGLKEIIEGLDLDVFLKEANQRLVDEDVAFSVLKEVDTLNNGYMLFEVGEGQVAASVYLVSPEYVSQKLYERDDINSFFTKKSFLVSSDGYLI